MESLQFINLLFTFLTAQIGVEVLKGLFLNKVFPSETLKEDERKWLGEVHRVSTKTDPDGSPLVYSPRAWQECQKEMLECIREINITQKETMVALGGLIKAIDKLTDKINP